MLQAQSPFQQFFDTSGQPLDGGYVYIGEAGLNAQSNPIPIYWDEAGTQPAAQPLRTSGGYIARSGTPSRVYVDDTDYSIIIRTRDGVLVASALDVTAVTYSDLAAPGLSLIHI